MTYQNLFMESLAACACLRAHSLTAHCGAVAFETKRMLQARPGGRPASIDRRHTAPGALCGLCRHRTGLRAGRHYLAKASEGAAATGGGDGGTGNLLSTTIRWMPPPQNKIMQHCCEAKLVSTPYMMHRAGLTTTSLLQVQQLPMFLRSLCSQR